MPTWWYVYASRRIRTVCPDSAQKLFSDPAAWVVLDDDEKADLLSLLPDQVAKAPEVSGENSEAVVESTVSAIPSAEFLRYSNDWRDALRQYQNDLSTGRYDPEWQRQAAVAMEERAQGKFDNFKEEQFEEYWGQKAQFDTSNDTEKEWGYERSAQIKMPKLIKDEVFKVGDVWKFTRLFEKEKIVIEKEARIAEIPKITSMNFVVPDGQRASFAVVDVADDAKEEAKGDAADDKAEVKEADADVMDVEVAVNDVTGPNMLALKILAIDGRMKSSSPGNVWTCFRAFRDGQDLGTLSEIRQAWFDKQNF